MSQNLDHSPADILRSLLPGIGIGTLPSAVGQWPVYASNMPDRPDNLIVTYDTTPVLQGRTHPDGNVQERFGIQIIVRSVDDPTGNRMIRLAAEALSTVYGAAVTIGGAAYVVGSVMRTSGPIPLGEESPETRRRLFSLNVTTVITQSAP